MNYERIECIDSGTEFCPCHLAQMNECILCSQLQGKCFCDCKNWKGTCIYQEFINNNSNPKKGRDTFSLPIISIDFPEDNLAKITLKAGHKLVMDLLNPGAFVFFKGDEKNIFFDFPISVANADPSNDTLTFYIEVHGPKTKKILNLKTNDNLLIRAPYFNGTFGLKNISLAKNSKVLLISRGIGIAPSFPVYKKLLAQNNDITVINDISPFKADYFSEYNLDSIIYSNMIDKGELSKEIQDLLLKYISNGITHIHCGGADILTYKLIDFLESINRLDITLSCCNNAKMCCGEGMCGSCTVRFAGHNVKRLCKVQTDPINIFKGRRFI
ncbi:MAG: sulfide/dihydroorotate dehydrogenase-like FAD/NAD-binding protein [Sarcina sp.]